MTDGGRPDPDAWEVETDDQSWHDSRNLDTTIKRHFTYIPAHERKGKEALFSVSTIQSEIQKADSLKELEEVFSGDAE